MAALRPIWINIAAGEGKLRVARLKWVFAVPRETTFLSDRPCR